MVRLTPPSTSVAPYPKRTSAACSKAHPDEPRAPRRREPECLFVLAIEEVRHTREELQRADHPAAGSRVHRHVARHVEQSAERPEVRLDVEHAAAAAGPEEARDPAAVPDDVRRRLVTWPAE